MSRDRFLLPLALLLLRALTPVGRVDALLKLNRLVDLDLAAEDEKTGGGGPPENGRLLMNQNHHTTPFPVEDNVDVLLDRLEGVRPAGPNSWMARCPAHEDRDPSLSVSVKEGRILIHCFAGCSADAVLEAVGLTWKDLREGEAWAWSPFPSRPRPKPEPEGPSPEDLERWEALWEGARPGHPLLKRYLRARGLSLEPPPTLRVAFLRGEPVMVARVEGARGGSWGST